MHVRRYDDDRNSEEEKRLIRDQLREANRLAKEVAIASGTKVHPRVAEIKSKKVGV